LFGADSADFIVNSPSAHKNGAKTVSQPDLRASRRSLRKFIIIIVPRPAARGKWTFSTKKQQRAIPLDSANTKC
jgi:hypothetical protein